MRTYNHALTLAFEISNSLDRDGQDITFKMFEAAVLKRIENLRTSPGEYREAILPPFDTFVSEVIPPDIEDLKEGWILSYTTGTNDIGNYRIERDDEAGVFLSDMQAWRFVAYRARCGSVHHQEVLDFIKEENPTEWLEISSIIKGFQS